MASRIEHFVTGWLLNPTVAKLLSVALSILVIVALVRAVRGLLNRYVQEPGNLYRARKMVTFVGYLVAVTIFALIFSDRLGRMAVAFGVAGAGIAFALQEVIASLAGWVAISFGNFYSTGDRVQLGGIKGDVIDIGMLRTTMLEIGQWVDADLYNGRIVKIANSFVFKEPVFNYSSDFPFLWDEIKMPVKYGSDRVLARELFQRVLTEITGDYTAQAKVSWREMFQRYRMEPTDLDSRIYVVANENWLEFTLRYVVDYKRRRRAKDQLFTRLLDEIDRTAGRVTLASATVELVDAPELSIKLTQALPES